MDFPEDGSVYLKIGAGEKQKLENVIFNRYGLLNADFTGQVPLPQYDGRAPIHQELILYLDHGDLVGHIGANISNEKGSFRYGVFTALQRE